MERERGPKTKPRMTKPKGHAAGQTMPREARRQLMREYMEKGREAAIRYGAGIAGAAESGGNTTQKPEGQAVQQVEDSLRDGAQSAGRAGVSAAKQGKDRFMQSQRQKKARRQYVVEKAGKAEKVKQAERAGDSEHTGQTGRPGRVLDAEHSGSAASSTGKAGKGATSATTAGGKGMPKTRGKAKAVKDSRGTALAKLGRPGARTSKAALAGRKAGNLRKAAQLKQRAAKLAQAAARRSAQAARRVAILIKNVAKAVVKTLMLIVSAAGPFVLILIAFAGIAMMIASPFGLFFSGSDTGQGVAPVSAVIRDVAADFNGQMLAIQNGSTWDELRVHYAGKRGNNWQDVLAVFAVKTVLFDEEEADVVTIDADKAERIKAVFWDMTELSHRMETIEHHDETTGATTYTYILHITITQRDAGAQADRYGFDQDQRDILAEMLSGAYDEFFRNLIGGAGELGDGTPVIGTGSYIWPSDSSSRVTSYFGYREHPVTGEADDHLGIDIGAGGGTNILAADAGRVVAAEWHWSYGNHIIIDHGDGRRTLYAHLSMMVAIAGQNVAQGEIIGLVGATGMTNGGAHIHFETLVNSGRVDPLSYFSGYG